MTQLGSPLKAQGSADRWRDPMLDGLRGVAAVAVVYDHYMNHVQSFVRAGGGHVGVLVFFVLSGYLISRTLWLSTPVGVAAGYRRFVRRRFRRLYPALVGVVLVAAPLMTVVGPEDASTATANALVVLAQGMALWITTGQLTLDAWVPTWSLTVEWIFYLSWPIALLEMRRRGLEARTVRRVAWGLAAVLYVSALPLSPAAFYFLPVANLGVLLLGAGLAMTHVSRDAEPRRGRDPHVVDLAFLLFITMVITPASISGHPTYRFSYFLFAVLVAFYVIDHQPGTSSRTKRFLESSTVAAIGRGSYSLYLWHLPVLWVVWWSAPELSPPLKGLLALGVLVPTVFLSYRFLERPVLRPAGVRRQTSRT